MTLMFVYSHCISACTKPCFKADTILRLDLVGSCVFLMQLHGSVYCLHHPLLRK